MSSTIGNMYWINEVAATRLLLVGLQSPRGLHPGLKAKPPQGGSFLAPEDR